ncbi:hypothetical protein [Paenibacillus macquariensis]|uniref:Uncharacterized protein n=1 Tax=Paenibacillus macquariensis TaxID=948756 RepID=A0ABY1KDP5_9BACL|nr:hypothetical protein [Paenibacillus macquariensis]OAB27367.1 hypothetical protein PMSM_25480 [Paenibacillus macquariensis subsp. macquariensis]SIR66269.1 hypothetical protein SAMN05421578_12918 [Paenibacillus macquariensis]
MERSNEGVAVESLSLITPYHRMLYTLGLRKTPAFSLPTFMPYSVVGMVDIGDLSMEGYPLDKLIVKEQAKRLASKGVNVPAVVSSSAKFRNALIKSYFLDTCVVVAQVQTRNGLECQMLTKNMELLALLEQAGQCVLDSKNHLGNFKKQCITTDEEVSTGTFQAVQLIPTVSGYKLSKQKLSERYTL